MKKILKTTLLFVSILYTSALISCTEKDCPDDMVKCTDSGGNTFCVPKSTGC